MGIVTEAGFYGGKFRKAGQFHEAEKESVATGAAPGGAAPPVDLEAMTKDDLLAEAERRGVTVQSSDTKAKIVDAIRAAEAG